MNRILEVPRIDIVKTRGKKDHIDEKNSQLLTLSLLQDVN